MPGTIFGKGTKLQRNTAVSPAPATWQTIAEVKSITGPGMTGDILDVTTHDTIGNWREKIAGLLDAGTLTFTVNFIPDHLSHSSQTGFVADFVNRTKRDHQIIFPDALSTTWLFPNAQITGCPITAPVDNVLTAEVTLTITEPPELDQALILLSSAERAAKRREAAFQMEQQAREIAKTEREAADKYTEEQEQRLRSRQPPPAAPPAMPSGMPPPVPAPIPAEAPA
jgi:predicted secreted protein